MSDGTHGHGASLTLAPIAATASTTTIGNITNLSNSQTRDSIDISTMDSTDKFREFIGGMADAGELTFTCNYDGSDGGTANDLNTIYQDGGNYEAVVTFPDTSSWKSDGIVTSLGFVVPYDDKISQDVTIKMSGKPTFTDV